ncbi:MAG: hypothetical protein FWC70_05750 [Defluviitaleaceae bacterium]|nr:hypothetical protein [Defluviitaleaceae bacterium]
MSAISNSYEPTLTKLRLAGKFTSERAASALPENQCLKEPVQINNDWGIEEIPTPKHPHVQMVEVQPELGEVNIPPTPNYPNIQVVEVNPELNDVNIPSTPKHGVVKHISIQTDWDGAKMPQEQDLQHQSLQMPKITPVAEDAMRPLPFDTPKMSVSKYNLPTGNGDLSAQLPSTFDVNQGVDLSCYKVNSDMSWTASSRYTKDVPVFDVKLGNSINFEIKMPYLTNVTAFAAFNLKIEFSQIVDESSRVPKAYEMPRTQLPNVNRFDVTVPTHEDLTFEAFDLNKSFNWESSLKLPSSISHPALKIPSPPDIPLDIIPQPKKVVAVSYDFDEIENEWANLEEMFDSWTISS